jgi:hypothetical protein
VLSALKFRRYHAVKGLQSLAFTIEAGNGQHDWIISALVGRTEGIFGQGLERIVTCFPFVRCNSVVCRFQYVANKLEASHVELLRIFTF